MKTCKQKSLEALAFVCVVLIGMLAYGAWTTTYDTTTPDGATQPVSVLDDAIQDVKKAVQERINVDHYFPLTGTQVSDTDTGFHRQVTFYSATGTDPILDITLVSGTMELQWTDSDGTVKQLTTGGEFNVTSAELLGKLANDTYFTAVDNAGTGTVNLVKATTGDVAQLPDASRMATSAAPTADAELANKKYVDDQFTANVVKYVSSWAAVATAGTYTLTHNLGSDEIQVTVQFKDTTNAFGLGANRIYQIFPDLSSAVESGCCITNITSTQVTIQVGINQVAKTWDTSGINQYASSGEYRVIATFVQ